MAEDDLGHYKLIEKHFFRIGFRSKIVHFLDGQELLDFLFGPNYDPEVTYLLVLDIRMPRVGGVEALEKIKSDRQLSKIPVIMLTSSDDERDMRRCRELGCEDYVVKPVIFNEFERAIQKVGISLLLSVLTMSGLPDSKNTPF